VSNHTFSLMKVTKLCCTGLIAAAAGLFFAPAAQANDWFFLTEAEDGSFKVFVDNSSITRSGNMARMLALDIYAQPDQSGVIGYQGVYEYSCNSQEYRVVQGSLLYDDQTTRPERITNPEWIQVRAGTIAEAALAVACGL